jgi:ubiquinone biosynthesis accessory factor UbiJ
MPATAAWLASAEALLNRSIGASARALALAKRLDGTSLQMDVEGVVRIRASAHHGRLALLAAGDTPADATIAGTLPALLQLLKGGANSGAGKTGAEIRGNAEIANRYRELFILARPDPEEELSRWIGDLPARRAWQFAQRVREFAGRTRRTIGENIAEYLQEEGRDLVNSTELEEFLRGVDEVRERFDRIEARIVRLEARLEART